MIDMEFHSEEIGIWGLDLTRVFSLVPSSGRFFSNHVCSSLEIGVRLDFWVLPREVLVSGLNNEAMYTLCPIPHRIYFLALYFYRFALIC